MKQHLLLICTVLFTINSYAQISYENGYIISNNGEKIDCLIKNVDWKNNPSKFEYKLTETSEKQVGNLQNIIEFGIDNISRYVKSQVKIDRSNNDINDLSTNKNVVLEVEVLFLKVLVEGESTLYSYSDGNLNRYFYSTKNDPTEQLIYKIYITPGNKIAYNKGYKTQLFNSLKCPNLAFTEIDNADYKKQSLVNLFIKYNECKSATFTNFTKKPKRNTFNLNARVGAKFSSLNVENTASSSRYTDFGGKLGLRTGLELEFIMPFNKNKWAIIIEPTYQSFEVEKETEFWALSTNYKSIEIPFGIRHYFFLNDKSKIFIDAAYVVDTDLNSSIRTDLGGSIIISTRNNIAMGVGFKYNDKVSLQFRTQSTREILNTSSFWISDYRTSSIILGYSIL